MVVLVHVPAGYDCNDGEVASEVWLGNDAFETRQRG
jgi:hypothetical protein